MVRIPSLGSTAVIFPTALAQSGWARSARVKIPVPEPILKELGSPRKYHLEEGHYTRLCRESQMWRTLDGYT